MIPTMKFTPTKYTFVMADVNIMKTREVQLLKSVADYGGFYLYFTLAMMFANYDGCLAYAETDCNGATLLYGYDFSVVGNNLAVDKRLLQRLRKEGISDDDSERYITYLMRDDIHLLYQRPDGFWALTGLTSDKSGPRLHIDDNIGYTGLLGDNRFVPLVIRGLSQTRDLSLPEPEPLPALANAELEVQISGMTMYELAIELSRNPNTFVQWSRRNNLTKYFVKVGTTKILPDYLQNDFLEVAKKKMSVEEFHEKWQRTLDDDAINAVCHVYKNKDDIKHDIAHDKREIKDDIANENSEITNPSKQHENSVNMRKSTNVMYDVNKDDKHDIKDDTIHDIRDIIRDTNMTSDSSKSLENSINMQNSENVMFTPYKNIRIKEYKNNIDDDDDLHMQELFQTQIQYDKIRNIMSERYHPILDSIVSVCVNILSDDSELYRINSTTVSNTDDLKQIVKKLNFDSVTSMLMKIGTTDNGISDVQRYFLTMLSKLNHPKNPSTGKHKKMNEVPMPKYWEKKDDYSKKLVSDEQLNELRAIQEKMENSSEEVRKGGSI